MLYHKTGGPWCNFGWDFQTGQLQRGYLWAWEVILGKLPPLSRTKQGTFRVARFQLWNWLSLKMEEKQLLTSKSVGLWVTRLLFCSVFLFYFNIKGIHHQLYCQHESLSERLWKWSETHCVLLTVVLGLCKQKLPESILCFSGSRKSDLLHKGVHEINVTSVLIWALIQK